MGNKEIVRNALELMIKKNKQKRKHHDTHCPHCGDIYPQAHIKVCYNTKCVAKENMK